MLGYRLNRGKLRLAWPSKSSLIDGIGACAASLKATQSGCLHSLPYRVAVCRADWNMAAGYAADTTDFRYSLAAAQGSRVDCGIPQLLSSDVQQAYALGRVDYHLRAQAQRHSIVAGNVRPYALKILGGVVLRSARKSPQPSAPCREMAVAYCGSSRTCWLLLLLMHYRDQTEFRRIRCKRVKGRRNFAESRASPHHYGGA